MDKQGTQFYLNILLLHKSTETVMVEGQWPLAIDQNIQFQNPDTAPRLLHIFLLYPIPNAWAKQLWHHKMMLESSASPFQQKKHCACTGEPHWSTCAPVSIPTNYFLLLCIEPCISITQILSLWHSPPGFQCTLIPEPWIYSQHVQDRYRTLM